MIDIAEYLGKVYPSPPCWALVADVYVNALAHPVDGFSTVNNSVRSIASAFRLAIHKNPNGFKQIPEPVEGCVVLLGKTHSIGLHHCGVYTDGKVLHALDSGNYLDEMSVIQDRYELIEFWAIA